MNILQFTSILSLLAVMATVASATQVIHLPPEKFLIDRAQTEPLETRVAKAKTIFVGTLINRVEKGDWVTAELKVDQPMLNAQLGAKVDVIWRRYIDSTEIYNAKQGDKGVAILDDKHQGRYWLRADKFEPESALKLVQELLPETKQKLTVAGIFGDRMVLQQQTAAAIWGNAQPDAKVSIQPSWQKNATVTTADADGKWTTKVNTPKAGGPFTLTVKAGGQKKVFKDILSGEVWICSGQSNMQWKMKGFGVDHFKEDVQKADHPQIRYFQVPQTLSLKRQDDLKSSWSVCTPKTVLSYSAVGYFFGQKLHRELNVPIGLISTNWGGSSAEAWINEKTLADQFPEFDEMAATYPSLIEKSGVLYRMGKRNKGVHQRLPSVLYNNMIHPIVPYSFRGVIWYQGESNIKFPVQYRKLFPTLISSWREEWNQGDFPFYFVQIAPFHYRTNPLPAAMLREAQLQALAVPNTGMVVTMDIGNPDNVHPKQKKPVAERLARLALAKDYGKTDLVYSGPQFSGMEVESNQMRLRFQYVADGLTTRDGKSPSHFQVAGSDRVFHPATAKIDDKTVLVSSKKVPSPVAVRYGWGNADEPNLANAEGLPCSSFRSDDWEIKPKIKTPKKRPSK